MTTIDAVREYLDGALGFDDLHGHVQMTHLRKRPDPFSAEVLRVLGEATSADWDDETVHRVLRGLIDRAADDRHMRVTGSGALTFSGRLGDTTVGRVRPQAGENKVEGHQELAQQPA